MTAVKEAFHGSDLEKVEAVYGIPKEKIVSFAANVNPLGISIRLCGRPLRTTQARARSAFL